MSLSRFTSGYRKDLSTEMIRTKIAHRKSLSQKENRYKEYERNRHFGLKDVNIPLEGRILNVHETPQDLGPEKASTKPKSVKTVLSDQRKQMLQKYKEEKQLQKLKEQREKAKREVFKVGLYRPDVPGYLLTNQKTLKTEPKKAFPSNVQITRSKTKDQMEQTKTDSRNAVRAVQSGQRQTSEKKRPDTEKKVVQPIVSMSGRVTRSATQMTKEIARTISSTTARKPVTRAANDNEPERKAPSNGRPGRKIDTKPDKVISSKVNNEENTLDSQSSITDEMGPDGVLSEMENLLKTNPGKMRGKISFAPKDFMFQPLDGLKTYQVAPMTPRSANAFLTPSYDWNPRKLEGDITHDATKEFLAQRSITNLTNTAQQDSDTSQCTLDSLTVCSKEHGFNQKEATAKDSNCLLVKEVTSLEGNAQVSQPQHDVPYFRNILQSETDKLTSHCLEWDRKLELDIPDDAKDLIRTAVGQTRLLIKERFKQFEGLVDDCEYKRGEKETTCTDLDGFWDMVSFQVEDVNQKFNNLVKLEQSGWQNNNNPSKKVLRKKIIPGIPSKPKQDDSGRTAARNRLAAIKSAMKERRKQEEHTEAVAAGIPKEVDKIVFEAGFFRVESPIKSFSVLSSERHSRRFGTPQSASKVVPESRAKVDFLRQRLSPENPDPQSSQSEHTTKTLFSNTLESRYSRVEDAQCPGLQDLIDVNYDVNKINFKEDYLPSETSSLPPLAGITDDITITPKEAISHVLEGMDQNSSVTSQDVLMSSPEKNIPLQNNISQEEAKISQSVSFGKSLTTECYLLDSPGLSCTNPCPQVESRHQDHVRNFSFGGDLIAFSPLRPFSREQPHY